MCAQVPVDEGIKRFTALWEPYADNQVGVCDSRLPFQLEQGLWVWLLRISAHRFPSPCRREQGVISADSFVAFYSDLNLALPSDQLFDRVVSSTWNLQ